MILKTTEHELNVMDYIELLRQEKLIFGGINYKIINGIIDYILTMVLKQDRLWKYDTKHIMEIYRIIIIEPLCLPYLFIYLYSIFITIWVGLFVIGDFAESNFDLRLSAVGEKYLIKLYKTIY